MICPDHNWESFDRHTVIEMFKTLIRNLPIKDEEKRLLNAQLAPFVCGRASAGTIQEWYASIAAILREAKAGGDPK